MHCLCSAGASANLKGGQGLTPLLAALETKQPSVVEVGGKRGGDERMRRAPLCPSVCLA